MKAIKTLIISSDESRKDKLKVELVLLCKNEVSDAGYDNLINVDNSLYDVIIIDMQQTDEKESLGDLMAYLTKLKTEEPANVTLLSGKYSAKVKKGLAELIDVFSGVTPMKVKSDFRQCLDLIICRKYKLNYYLTDFFAPHLVGDLERKGFELVLNDTYEREEYKEDFVELWKSFMFIAPLLKQGNREMLKSAMDAYEERDLYQKEKDAINEEFFFQFTNLHSLGNFSERRLYYLEKSVIENVWKEVMTFAREVDNSLLFGCHKLQDVIKLKVMTHKAYPLKKITKTSDIYKTLASIEPYADVVVTSNGEELVIGSKPAEQTVAEGIEVKGGDDTLTFEIYIKIILPHRRHRGLKRF